MKEKGSLLIGVILILAGILIVISVSASSMIRYLRTQTARKTAYEIKTIARAVKAYYVIFDKWPSSIENLTTDDAKSEKIQILPPSWKTKETIYGGKFTLKAEPDNTFTITVNTPPDAIPVLSNFLENFSASKSNIVYKMTPPGEEPGVNYILSKNANSSKEVRTIYTDVKVKNIITVPNTPISGDNQIDLNGTTKLDIVIITCDSETNGPQIEELETNNIELQGGLEIGRSLNILGNGNISVSKDLYANQLKINGSLDTKTYIGKIGRFGFVKDDPTGLPGLMVTNRIYLANPKATGTISGVGSWEKFYKTVKKAAQKVK